MPSDSTPLLPRPGHRYPVGVSRRGSDNPLRHAATTRPASRTGYNVKALCGASICPAGDWVNKPFRNQTFGGTHDRDCPRCAAILARVAHYG